MLWTQLMLLVSLIVSWTLWMWSYHSSSTAFCLWLKGNILKRSVCERKEGMASNVCVVEWEREREKRGKIKSKSHVTFILAQKMEMYVSKKDRLLFLSSLFLVFHLFRSFAHSCDSLASIYENSPHIPSSLPVTLSSCSLSQAWLYIVILPTRIGRGKKNFLLPLLPDLRLRGRNCWEGRGIEVELSWGERGGRK